MTFLDRVRGLFGSKSSQARIAMSITSLGQPVTTPAGYAGFSKEGYQKNVIVYRCIRLIATACAGIKWELYDGKREIENHPILTLMQKPNTIQGWSGFFESFVSYFLISGNTYIEGVSPTVNGPPLELWSLRPDLMKIVPNQFGGVGEFQFKTGSYEKRWVVDPVTGKSRIMHSKTFHPLDIWYGMSPIEAVLLGVDQNNQSNRWNLALLQNNASPAGVLKVKTSDQNPTGGLSNEQYARLKNDFENNHQGAKNASRPLLLEGNMDWQNIGFNPKDMEWLEGKKTTSLDICNAFGVPGQLLGFGQTTYANYGEAKSAFYTETVLPLMDFFEYELNKYFKAWFGGTFELKYDRDDIEALAEKRQSKYTLINGLNFITQNEKRQIAGYEKAEGWDVYLIGNQLVANPEETSLNNSTEQDSEEGDNNGKETSKESNEETSTEEIGDEEDEKGWKSFNLLNRNEKTSTWKRVNSLRKRLEKPFARSLEQDFEELAKSLEKAIEGKEPKTAEYALQKAIDDGMVDISKTIQRHLKFAVTDFGRAVFQNAKSSNMVFETKKSERTWEQWADSFIKSRTARAITEIEGTTRKQVRKVVQRLVTESIQEDADVNFAKELRDIFTDLSPGRARTIARTEVSMASNSSTLEAAKSLEIPGMKKEWVSVQDARTRDGGDKGSDANHLDMNGVRVDLDEKFTVPPDADMDGPGDQSGGADQVCNCRCTLIFTATR